MNKRFLKWKIGCAVDLVCNMSFSFPRPPCPSVYIEGPTLRLVRSSTHDCSHVVRCRCISLAGASVNTRANNLCIFQRFNCFGSFISFSFVLSLFISKFLLSGFFLSASLCGFVSLSILILVDTHASLACSRVNTKPVSYCQRSVRIARMHFFCLPLFSQRIFTIRVHVVMWYSGISFRIIGMGLLMRVFFYDVRLSFLRFRVGCF